MTRYWADAEVSYYEMEGEWNIVDEPVGVFDSVQAAKDACYARRQDHIEWTDNGGGQWQGDIDPNQGMVIFHIRPMPERTG
jgi:hypothetical protein